MARIGTSWNRIQAGDIITFNYKSKGSGKTRLQIYSLTDHFVMSPSLFLNHISLELSLVIVTVVDPARPL